MPVTEPVNVTPVVAAPLHNVCVAVDAVTLGVGSTVIVKF